jgi:hypothetical protein
MTDAEQAIERFIEGSEKLTQVFGYGPTFHDAEVLDVHLWRGDVKPDAKQYVFPVLTVKLHVWELTSEVNPYGYLVLRHHTLATLRFHDVLDFRMEGFNHQNAIFGLSIVCEQRTEWPSPGFAVNFDPAFGMEATFVSSRVEVIEAIPCSDKGIPLEESSTP